MAVNHKKEKKNSKNPMSVLNILDKLGEKVNMWFILLGSADYNAILISLSGRWAGGGGLFV